MQRSSRKTRQSREQRISTTVSAQPLFAQYLQLAGRRQQLRKPFSRSRVGSAPCWQRRVGPGTSCLLKEYRPVQAHWQRYARSPRVLKHCSCPGLDGPNGTKYRYLNNGDSSEAQEIKVAINGFPSASYRGRMALLRRIGYDANARPANTTWPYGAQSRSALPRSASPRVSYQSRRTRAKRSTIPHSRSLGALEFLERCKRLWPSGLQKLANWQAVIRAGGIPDFFPHDMVYPSGE